MAKLIIIRGPLGVGKTTIAKNLASALAAKYFSIDQVLSENNLDFVDEKIGCIAEQSFISANEIILPKIKNCLKKGTTVVVDGNFYHKKQIEHLIENTPNTTFVFTLKASLNTCIERDKKRELSYGKDAAEAVYNMVSSFDYGEAIDTENLTQDQVVKKVMSSLEK